MSLLILCDTEGNQTGLATWEEAHGTPGKLHRAFSVYVFRKGGKEILLQKRSQKKPLWPLIWANTCCSHPRQGEEVKDIAPERLQQECGFTCELQEAGTLLYRAEDPSGNGVEHEFVTLLKGEVADDAVPQANPDEVAELRWVKVEELKKTMEAQHEQFAPWFHLGLSKLRPELKMQNGKWKMEQGVLNQ